MSHNRLPIISLLPSHENTSPLLFHSLLSPFPTPLASPFVSLNIHIFQIILIEFNQFVVYSFSLAYFESTTPLNASNSAYSAFFSFTPFALPLSLFVSTFVKIRVCFFKKKRLGMELQEEKVGRRRRDEEEVMVEEEEMSLRSPLQRELVVVGYALTSKKIKSFLQPKLQGLARNKGIMFVAIDQNKPLSDQGPFDVVLHKLTGKEWRQVLEDYRRTHPEVTVLDPPDAIQHLHNRQSMLQCVADMKLNSSYGRVDVPKQLVIKRDASSIPDAVTKAGLILPIVAKPLVADGSSKSHELSLAYDQHSLRKLEPPLVLQEFVNHGGVLFKVYIVGETIKVVRRFSLPDVCERELANNPGVFRFPRVSCAAASADDADLDPRIAELPPQPLLEKLAKELRRRLGLRLFNLDIIREHGTRDQFYVIDINYFPGYGKMPEYEHIFTDFLLSLVQSQYKKRSG